MRSGTATPRGNIGIDRKRARGRVIRRYSDDEGAPRELVARAAAEGLLLLIDRDAPRGRDERLVAHLAADEPRENATIAARLYLEADPAGRRCRTLEAEDELRSPLEPVAAGESRTIEGSLYRLRLVPCGMSIPAIRWCRGDGVGHTVISLRETIAAAESYEPFRELTRHALARHGKDPGVSSTVLRAEFGRVLESSIVLNRALREAVIERVSSGATSMSEIAMRCGRCKRDGKGNTTGETSWLARRIGLLPEGGQAEPTRWIHSDVLGLIAREGLGIAPREVELG